MNSYRRASTLQLKENLARDHAGTELMSDVATGQQAQRGCAMSGLAEHLICLNTPLA
jgi:hypothetical protein